MLEEIVIGEGGTAELGAVIARPCGPRLAQEQAASPRDRATVRRSGSTRASRGQSNRPTSSSGTRIRAGARRGARPRRARDLLRRGRRDRRRRLRGHAGALREVRADARLRHADLGAGDDRCRLRRGDHRAATGARDHVRRLPRALDGQPHQPDDEVLVPDGRASGLPGRHPLGRRRGRPLRRDPLADARLLADGHHGPEDRRARDACGREGPAEGGDPRRQSRRLSRAQAAVSAQGRGRLGAGPARASARRARGHGRDARQRDEGRARLPRGGRSARGRGSERRGRSTCARSVPSTWRRSWPRSSRRTGSPSSRKGR